MMFSCVFCLKLLSQPHDIYLQKFRPANFSQAGEGEEKIGQAIEVV